ncbi:hypothetical protein POSPLADRAFT_1053485 [Postia placenta MAD-698-R-SB12]|uniref:Uncharacterized protein n=1 Tax=Postia placenta MAD-698-R-SB12 TaxID=670580 RepID=A0A1X6N7T0_9APHY|nr:hypothetical protein POSPLADRAFT_1053485 [Postia placenta MAD-698-R-SB12]OSX64688.1 hypothetical protein POSPLADRAFT_1053485 [Postia placenta MAD-698-R-SB12]
MELVYGKVEISDRDETILAIARTMDGIGRDGGYPCLTIPDNIPIVRWIPSSLPGAGFKSKADVAKRATIDARERPYKMARAAMSAGAAKTSFTHACIEEANARGLLSAEEEDDIKIMAAMVYRGAPKQL